MTSPHQPASAAVSDEALFGPEVADYARYRPGLPPRQDAMFTVLLARRPGGDA
ncbi:hypothetical protein ACFH04_07170 [Streptomyces noboritoensis]|uniref:Uncharacterized protein n=1 Tax=Streptomyces noboritoensis TaxID=67337 RepID=A0ABV6TG89_9ACTN